MDRQQGLILAGVGAGLGCLIIGGLAVGFVFFVGARDGGSAAVPPSPPPATVPSSPSPTPGFLHYDHRANCLANPQLILPSFGVAYPAGYQVMPCTQQSPSPWSYVTFHRETPEGAEQVTVSWGHGQVTPQLLGQAADDLVRQLGAPATRELGTAPFPARGASLVRRDSAFDVPATVGPFLPGTYVFRQVYVPRQPEGVSLMLLAPARGGEPAALAATESTLRTIVESVTF